MESESRDRQPVEEAQTQEAQADEEPAEVVEAV